MDQFLDTKLYIPLVRPNLVSRRRLIEQLTSGLRRNLTLISAPAGYGKTTLVAGWLGDIQNNIPGNDCAAHRFAWLSLDEGDNDPTRFLSYFVNALARVDGWGTDIAKGALGMLQSAHSPAPKSVLTTLLNDLARVSGKVILVLDDYHLIESQAVHDALGFFIENMPTQLHLVLATREDPFLPIPRLRARDQVTELRAADLRFTSDETVEFINRVMGLDLSPEDITALESRTEGWIAGLQLAAISLKGKKDAARLVQSFSGSHRFVLDYLIEEVLEQQTEEIKTFLLQTAFLEILNGDLCDAVTLQENGHETLEFLEHSNIFIIPLDNERRWFRYHHLFADLLRQHLESSPKINVQELHLRARDWFSKQGMEREALQHSLLAEDYEEAVERINELSMDVVQKGEYRTVSDWINSVPEDIQKEHPFLWALDVWALRMEGHFEAAETRIAEVEEALKDPARWESANLVTIKGLINSHKAYIAFIRGDLEETVSISRESLAQLPQDMIVIRTLTALYLGVALRYQGKLDEALEIYLATLPYGKQLKGSSIAVFCFLHLADLYYDLGKLHKSKETAEQAIQFTNEHTGKPDWPFTGHAYICVGRILRQWGRLTEALEVIQRGVGLCRQWNVADVMALAYNELADINFSLGEKEPAQDALRESLQIYQEFSPWASGLVAAHQAKHSIGFGEIEPAEEWLSETGLDLNTPIDLSRDIEFLTMARVLIAQNKLDDGLSLLERIFEASNRIGKKYTTLEALILQAKAFFIREDTEMAMESLQQALIFGEKEECVQIFVDEGPPMAGLLYEALSKGIEPDYVQRLLAGFPVEKPDETPRTGSTAYDSDWIEFLSDRELEVLDLIAEGLTNQEIGSKLYLSLNTVKAHTRNIYGKLGVNNRTQAAAKARTLGILSHP